MHMLLGPRIELQRERVESLVTRGGRLSDGRQGV